MEMPVLLTIEESTLERIYSMIFNPYFMTFAAIVVFAIVILTIRFLEKREGRKKALKGFETGIKKPPAPPRPEKPREEELPVGERLEKRAGELRKKEEEFKAKKRAELEKREREIEEKEMGGGVGWERERAGRPALPGRRSETPASKPGFPRAAPERPARKTVTPPAAFPEKRVGAPPRKPSVPPVTAGGPPRKPAPPAGDGIAALEKERFRLYDMIEVTEERYRDGEIEEEEFKRLTADYYKRIIDIDIRIRRDSGPD